jgi:hypothetical protein
MDANKKLEIIKMLMKQKRKQKEVKKVKFLVIKGKILFPGRHGLDLTHYKI